jgi:hypothetical protein
LDYIDNEQGVMLPDSPTHSFKVRAKAGNVLHMADGNQTGPTIDQSSQLIQIDATISFLANTDFHAQGVADTQPRIHVRRELFAKGDEIIARLPTQTIRD